ncbi:MAG TPA: phosphomethylpyrimidine synthase, partial [Planctomycetota bacterium]|nr:phosphomethylpyrimidine synthase [Planctomycetota bacterium]
MVEAGTQPAGAPSEGVTAEFPRSHKVYRRFEHAGKELAVPARRIHLDGAPGTLDVYDTSGPAGCAPEQGLPKLRASWVADRMARGEKNLSQMHFARRGIVTEEMAFAAAREGMSPEFVRAEIA